MAEQSFEPRIVAFLCRWCAGAGADLAGTSRLKYPPNAIPIRVNCSGRVEPSWVVEALRSGADGVLIGGCHPGDCHYVSGNYKARRRVHLLRKVLAELGVEPERVRLEWVSATEGAKFARVMTEFVEEIRALGPLTPTLSRAGEREEQGRGLLGLTLPLSHQGERDPSLQTSSASVSPSPGGRGKGRG